MITDLRLQSFRSYADTTFKFGAGVNIIVGPNASGKTNLLEAILVLCRGSSYRARDADLIMHDRDWGRLDGTVNDQPRSLKLVRHEITVSKEFLVAATKLKRLPLHRSVPAVVFEPNHLQLLTESPDLRRGFLDDIIEQIIPGYGELRRNYKRTLAQRNSLLKQSGGDDQLFVWSLKLSELGGRIADHRLQYVKEHSPLLAALYAKLAGKKADVQLRYETRLSDQNYGSSMLQALESRKATDRERGYTTIGPHRDDLVPVLAGYPLAAAASRGETRTMLLALKLLELQSIEKVRGTKPILLLDDVFSELNGARRQRLTKYLQDHQTFITTTDADIVVQHFLDKCRVIPTSKTA